MRQAFKTQDGRRRCPAESQKNQKPHRLAERNSQPGQADLEAKEQRTVKAIRYHACNAQLARERNRNSKAKHEKKQRHTNKGQRKEDIILQIPSIQNNPPMLQTKNGKTRSRSNRQILYFNGFGKVMRLDKQFAPPSNQCLIARVGTNKTTNQKRYSCRFLLTYFSSFTIRSSTEAQSA